MKEAGVVVNGDGLQGPEVATTVRLRSGKRDVQEGPFSALDALDAEDVATYQPYWVTRARLADLSHDRAESRRCLERALGLTEDPAVRVFLARNAR